uniref:Protein vav n=2 Tax=Cacopsylla melanoneura TaxID=428564 RepID=A0A8D8M153_9HEMI
MADADNLWRECASWLTRCGVLREDHKANWPDASMSDLALTLRDGVVICNLLNNLDPDCIDMKEVNQKPQLAQFLCIRNIKTFIQVCRNYFDIAEHDLFEPSMLFDFGDFFKVLHTLSKLSQSPKVLRTRNLKGFSINPPRTLSQENIYKSLNTNDEVLMLPPRCPVGVEYEHRNYDIHVRNEEIYQDLCSVDKTLHVQQLSAVATEKRDYVINELIETEKNYVNVLATLYRCFMKPLCKLMKLEDFNVVFSGIKELNEIHRDFLSDLRKAISIPNSPIKLSDVFLKYKERFLIYGDYCANLTIAQHRIEELCNKNDPFRQEVVKCQEEANNDKFKLRDILSVPMQRILKYHLLLENLIAKTSENHEDYRGLVRAKEGMVDVAQYINEVKRDSDTLQIMREIQISDMGSRISADLKQYGKLLYDGDIRVKSHVDQKVKSRYIFIFDLVILMCKTVRNEKSYSFKEILYLKEYRLEDNTSKRVMPRDARWTFQWSLISKTGNSPNYTLSARIETLKQKCVKAIQDALDNIEPSAIRSTDHKFQMYSYDRATTCIHCCKFLKGRIFQGYRCEDCKVASHKQCLAYTGRCGTAVSMSTPRPPDVAGSLHLSNDWSANKTWQDAENLSEYLWFVGEMGRDKAASLLEREADGTYLLRIRLQGPTRTNDTTYALSLKTAEKVKHMRVYEKEMEGVPQYYLSHSRYFRSIVELICHYERASLSENFDGLNMRLQWPFRRIVAVAEFDFNPTEANQSNQLPLRKGCQVIVLSKEGEQKGWWKGKIDDRIGFFPKVYVREISDTLNSAIAAS